MNAGDFARQLARINAPTYRSRCRAMRGRGYARRATRALVKRAGAREIKSGDKAIGYMLPSGQGVCIKERHTTRDAALHVLSEASQYAHEYRVPVRAYPCAMCGGWHLTSMPKFEV